MCTTTPNVREIPAGKILLAEYGDVDETNQAQTNILERVLVAGRCYILLVFESVSLIDADEFAV